MPRLAVVATDPTPRPFQAVVDGGINSLIASPPEGPGVAASLLQDDADRAEPAPLYASLRGDFKEVDWIPSATSEGGRTDGSMMNLVANRMSRLETQLQHLEVQMTSTLKTHQDSVDTMLAEGFSRHLADMSKLIKDCRSGSGSKRFSAHFDDNSDDEYDFHVDTVDSEMSLVPELDEEGAHHCSLGSRDDTELHYGVESTELSSKTALLTCTEKDIDEDSSHYAEANDEATPICCRPCVDMFKWTMGDGWRNSLNQAFSAAHPTPSMTTRDSTIRLRQERLVEDEYRQFFLTEKGPCLSRLVRSTGFSIVSGAVISLNAMFMGLQAEYDMDWQIDRLAGEHEEPINWVPVDLIFCALMTLELVLRVIGLKCGFCFGSEWLWNLLDVVVVGGCLWHSIFRSSDSKASSAFRVLRMIRLVRLLSALRKVPCLRKLEHMLVALLNTIPTLVPAMLMLMLLMFVFVVFFMQGLTNYLATVEPGWLDSDTETLIDCFGSVHHALETLFLSVVGGRNWDGLLKSLRKVGLLYEVTFPLYVGFVTFAVLNILTGIFVDAAQQFSSMDRELVVELQVDKEEEYVKGLLNLFVEADTDKSGTLTWDEFMRHFEDPEVRAYLKGMDLNVTSAKKIFNLIDSEGKGEIAIQPFLETCLQLRGQAQVVDIVIMRTDLEQMVLAKMEQMLNNVHSLTQMTTKVEKLARQNSKRDMLAAVAAAKSDRTTGTIGEVGPLRSEASGAALSANSAVSRSVSLQHYGTTRSEYGGTTRSQRNSFVSHHSSVTVQRTNTASSSVLPVDLGSYGNFRTNGAGITGLRNSLNLGRTSLVISAKSSVLNDREYSTVL